MLVPDVPARIIFTNEITIISYFAYIHPGLPVVNKVLFLKQYRRQLGDYPSPPLLNSIYGAAARYIETCRIFDDNVLSDIANSTMKEGWSESLFDNLLTYLKGRYTAPCIATIQALVISQYHRASLDEKVASGWLLNSAVSTCAIGHWWISNNHFYD